MIVNLIVIARSSYDILQSYNGQPQYQELEALS
jgi:hypothetical protein